MWVCKKCGTNNSDNSYFCGNCGQEKNNTHSKKRSFNIIMIAFVFIAFVGAAIVLANSIGHREASTPEAVWSQPTYTWSSDNSSVTAKRIAQNDPSQEESETVSTSSKVSQSATCTAFGKTTYIAVFSNPAFEMQTNVLSNVPPLGHSYGEWTTTKKATCSAPGTRQRVCVRDPSHVETQTTPQTEHIWIPATCTRAETCQNCGATRGSAKAHSWVAATSNSPKHCSVCWKEAPSSYDLSRIGAKIGYPSNSDYFDEYLSATIKSSKGYGVYAYYSLKNADSHFTVLDGERITVLAQRGEYCCVIVDSKQKAGWVNAGYVWYD